MSMTIKRGFLALPVVLAGWVVVMAAVMRFSDSAPAAVVPFPRAQLLAALPEDSGILGLNRWALTVKNDEGMVKALYEAGALLVLPAGLTGCLPLTDTQRQLL